MNIQRKVSDPATAGNGYGDASFNGIGNRASAVSPRLAAGADLTVGNVYHIPGSMSAGDAASSSLMSARDRAMKRTFDIVISAVSLLLLWPLILISAVLIRVESPGNPFFMQKRIGRHGKIFTVVKLRTMRSDAPKGTTITVRNDVRITRMGAWLRKLKIDELPQLWNIIKGEMSLVGPRPDVPGYADELKGSDRAMLALRPGITGPATLKYRDEEELLAAAKNPTEFNDTVIWPDKVRINLDYMRSYSLSKDLRYLLATVHVVDHGVD